jgi:hypothetical protein
LYKYLQLLAYQTAPSHYATDQVDPY